MFNVQGLRIFSSVAAAMREGFEIERPTKADSDGLCSCRKCINGKWQEAKARVENAA